ncbi:hypothetical protein WR25_00443 [Diploscapter pachys]|uniref:Uncharacterized protein n=1 Tax=Diploscapter pachys TaxID=2018661 RepID=A0A2A2K2D9_9BILA|nr:hypothetical protein WR25_00443 [Diploscapter pachys]
MGAAVRHRDLHPEAGAPLPLPRPHLLTMDLVSNIQRHPVLDLPRLLGNPIIQPLRSLVGLLGMPVQPVAPVLPGLVLDELDQPLTDHPPPRPWRHEQVFQVTEIIAAPGRAVEYVVNEAEDLPAVRGHGAVHGLGRVEEARPGTLGDGRAQLHLVEGLVLRPVVGPWLQVGLLHFAYENGQLGGGHSSNPFWTTQLNE